MNVKDALSLLGIGRIAEVTFEEAKKAYRLASKKYHPDRNPAGLQMMQAITEAWRYLEPLLKEHDFLHNKEAGDEKQAADYGEALNAVLNALLAMPGLNLEVCGSWVWISGDTQTHKAAIKALGCQWASKKKRWYYRPENYKSKGRGKFSMEEIRDKYGSSQPSRPDYKTVTAA